MTQPLLTLRIVLWALIRRRAAASKPCCYPSGVQQPDDIPCNASASNGACCGPNDICLTNGFCFQVGGVQSLVRGSCTDELWSSQSCPQICSDGNCPNIAVLGKEGFEHARRGISPRSFSYKPKKFDRVSLT